MALTVAVIGPTGETGTSVVAALARGDAVVAVVQTARGRQPAR